MKKAYIPYLKTLEKDLESLQEEIETQGKRLNIDTLNWEIEYPYSPIASATIAYSEEGILISFFVRGKDIRTQAQQDGEYVHEDSCVEFFMQKERGESYINFEFNASGTCYASHHKTIKDSIPFIDQEFQQIKRIATFSGQKLESNGEIHSWQVTTIIPWSIMGYDQIPQKMYANLYKCGDKTKHPHYLSWAPIEEEFPAFHRPQFFGEFVFSPKE